MDKLTAQVTASQKIAALYTQNLDDLTTGGQAAAELLAELGTDDWALAAQGHLNQLQLRISKTNWLTTDAQQAAGRAFNDAHTALQAAYFAAAS